MNNKINSVQDWLPYVDIYENGIIKLKNNSFVKIIKVSPINFNLKSNLEKEAILNSYKIFLKTCKFNIQILIQSNKEDLTSHISNIEKINKNEKEKIKAIKKSSLRVFLGGAVAAGAFAMFFGTISPNINITIVTIIVATSVATASSVITAKVINVTSDEAKILTTLFPINNAIND